MASQHLQRSDIRPAVEAAMADQPVVDMHTHVYPPAFGTPVPNATGKTDPDGPDAVGRRRAGDLSLPDRRGLSRRAPDKLPYEAVLEDEQDTSRPTTSGSTSSSSARRSPRPAAASSPTLQQLGLDPAPSGLPRLRRYFAEQDPDRYIDRVMELARHRIDHDDQRRLRRQRAAALARRSRRSHDPRFSAVLRIDPLLRDWPAAAAETSRSGATASAANGATHTVAEARRFLTRLDRPDAGHLPGREPAARVPLSGRRRRGERAGQTVLERVILPVCAERGLPFAMMIGSRLRVNPGLREAGDMGGKADVASVTNLCLRLPRQQVLRHHAGPREPARAGRGRPEIRQPDGFRLLVVPEQPVARSRRSPGCGVELLGTSFIPQHSDARILDQLIYKWDHSRRQIGRVLTEKYEDLLDAGWPLSRSDVERDVRLLLRDNFLDFLGWRLRPVRPHSWGRDHTDQEKNWSDFSPLSPERHWYRPK